MQVPCNVNKMPLHSSNFSASVGKSRDALPFKFCYIFLLLFVPSFNHIHRFSWRKTKECRLLSSVADPGCLSKILIFYPSQIPDMGSRIQKPQQKRGVTKICCHTFFCSHKFHKIVNYFIFEIQKKIRPRFQRIIKLFTQKFVTEL
jgi:hypothetical protein